MRDAAQGVGLLDAGAEIRQRRVEAGGGLHGGLQHTRLGRRARTGAGRVGALAQRGELTGALLQIRFFPGGGDDAVDQRAQPGGARGQRRRRQLREFAVQLRQVLLVALGFLRAPGLAVRTHRVERGLQGAEVDRRQRGGRRGALRERRRFVAALEQGAAARGQAIDLHGQQGQGSGALVHAGLQPGGLAQLVGGALGHRAVLAARGQLLCVAERRFEFLLVAVDVAQRVGQLLARRLGLGAQLGRGGQISRQRRRRRARSCRAGRGLALRDQALRGLQRRVVACRELAVCAALGLEPGFERSLVLGQALSEAAFDVGRIESRDADRALRAQDHAGLGPGVFGAVERGIVAGAPLLAVLGLGQHAGDARAGLVHEFEQRAQRGIVVHDRAPLRMPGAGRHGGDAVDALAQGREARRVLLQRLHQRRRHRLLQGLEARAQRLLVELDRVVDLFDAITQAFQLMTVAAGAERGLFERDVEALRFVERSRLIARCGIGAQQALAGPGRCAAQGVHALRGSLQRGVAALQLLAVAARGGQTLGLGQQSAQLGGRIGRGGAVFAERAPASLCRGLDAGQQFIEPGAAFAQADLVDECGLLAAEALQVVEQRRLARGDRAQPIGHHRFLGGQAARELGHVADLVLRQGLFTRGLLQLGLVRLPVFEAGVDHLQAGFDGDHPRHHGRQHAGDHRAVGQRDRDHVDGLAGRPLDAFAERIGLHRTHDAFPGLGAARSRGTGGLLLHAARKFEHVEQHVQRVGARDVVGDRLLALPEPAHPVGLLAPELARALGAGDLGHVLRVLLVQRLVARGHAGGALGHVVGELDEAVALRAGAGLAQLRHQLGELGAELGFGSPVGLGRQLAQPQLQLGMAAEAELPG